MNTSNTYLRYLDENKDEHFQSVADLMSVGILIDADSGNDMECDDLLYRKTANGYEEIK